MVMRFGFDPDIGAENYAPDDVDGNFLGAQTQEKAISDETRKLIDTRVKKYLSDAYELARKIILDHRDLHERIADALLEKEEMIQEEFDAFFEGVTSVPQKIAM